MRKFWKFVLEYVVPVVVPSVSIGFAYALLGAR